MAEKEYIEREEVLKIISRYDSSSDYHNGVVDVIGNIIHKLPAADVVPVKHGHWISLDDYFEDAQCSECGDALVIGDCSFNDFCECYKFCPNCGAKMDGGDNE